jgi:hypothetical protein
MKKVIIYSTGSTGERIYHNLTNRGGFREVIAFADDNPAYWGSELLGLKIISPEDIKNYIYDKIIIAAVMYQSIFEKLVNELGVPREKIDTSHVDSAHHVINRIKFIDYFAKIVYDKNMQGNIAEGGVFMGDFAKYLNKIFPDRTLYLFDTFEGFDKRDVEAERKNNFSEFNEGHLRFSSEEHIKAILPHPERAVICKGYFPETAQGIDDKFIFVNLDFDLYKPILAGLEFFYPKMAHGGIILVHDFFNDAYKGVKAAVNEFCDENGLAYMPIADEASAAIIKYC